MIDYVNACNALGGVVSIDVVLYRDGDLDRSQLEVLKAIRPGLAKKGDELDAWRAGRAVPPHNKAWHKPAFLMNAEGKYRLGPSVGDVHAARCGVDGNPATCAVAGNEWAWAYDVNLLRIEKLSCVVIPFATGGVAKTGTKRFFQLSVFTLPFNECPRLARGMLTFLATHATHATLHPSTPFRPRRLRRQGRNGVGRLRGAIRFV